MAPLVRPFFHPGSNTWSYVVHAPGASEAAVIDPVLDFDAKSARTATVSAQAIVDFVHQHGLEVRWLLETHAHADHLSAAHWLKLRHWPDATLAIGMGIRAVQKAFRPIFNLGEHFPVDGSQFDRLFEDGDGFDIGGISARVIAVPGHTSDSNAYLIGDALFTGDSLFMPDSGTARCDFPGGDAATLYRSIRRLFELPDATRVFVCHDYGARLADGSDREVACETSIGEQKRGNIHVREGIDEVDFVRVREARDATLAMPALILPAVQVNIRAGALPEAEDNGVRYLKLPIDRI